jgi:hypothetical protein
MTYLKVNNAVAQNEMVCNPTCWIPSSTLLRSHLLSKIKILSKRYSFNVMKVKIALKLLILQL